MNKIQEKNNLLLGETYEKIFMLLISLWLRFYADVF